MKGLNIAGFLKKKGIPVGLGVISLLLVLFLTTVRVPVITSLLNEAKYLIYDAFVQLHYLQSNDQVHVVIIDIDSKSVEKMGKWPWHREITAKLLDKVKEAGVVVTAFDMVMSEPDVNYALGLKKGLEKYQLPPSLANLPTVLEQLAPEVDSDKALAKAIKDYDVILGFLFDHQPESTIGELPPPLTDANGRPIIVTNADIYEFSGYKANLKLFTQAASSSGFVTNIPDPDGNVRHGLLIARYKDKIYPTLALATAMRYVLAEHVKLMWHHPEEKKELYGISIDGNFIPTDKSGRVLIPFYGLPVSLPYYSAVDVIEGRVGREELEGAVVIIGSSMVILADLHPAPLSQTFPGVEMVGNIAKSIIEQQVPSEFSWNQHYGYLFQLFLGIVLIVLLSYFRAWVMVLISSILFVSILLASFALFVYTNTFYSPVSFMLLIVLLTMINHSYIFLLEINERRRVKSLFGQYVPETYVHELIAHPEQWSIEGQLRTMTVFFSDIRNFTTMSEGLSPADLRRFLNRILTAQTEVIQDYMGTIDKYVGDMVVAFWGAPMDDKEHPLHAINAALEIDKRMPLLNEELKNFGLPSIALGIGIASGPMSVGDMGSEFRRAYTVIGDTVNLASRLEALTKYYKVSILVNETAALSVEDHIWRPIDKVRVKGKKEPVTIYQPLGQPEQVSEQEMGALDAYKNALEAYYQQDWKKAKKAFGALAKAYPDVHVYELYLERINALIESPPEKDWDGVFTHSKKTYE